MKNGKEKIMDMYETEVRKGDAWLQKGIMPDDPEKPECVYLECSQQVVRAVAKNVLNKALDRTREETLKEVIAMIRKYEKVHKENWISFARGVLAGYSRRFPTYIEASLKDFEEWLREETNEK